MRRLSVRSCLAGSFALFVSLVLTAPIPVPNETFAEDTAVDLVGVPPLGVTGSPKGEELRSEPLSGDVLAEPPSDVVPVAESWAARLRREQASAVSPAVVGFDATRSVENSSERTAYGTTFDNVDGTKTTVLDDHLVHYLVDGQWERIDPRVVESRDGVWTTKANDRIATFSADSIELAVGDERLRWAPVGVKLPEPTVSSDGLTVTYSEVWPGVDLRYRLETDMVVEEIVISNAASVPVDGSFAFEVSGPGLKVTDEGVLSLEGALAEDLFFGVVEVLDREGSPISRPSDVSLTVSDRRVADAETVDTLTVAIDPAWASRLPSSMFPLIVDPTTVWGATTQNATSHIGNACSTNPLCSKSRVGNAYAGGNNQYWHTGLGFNYSAYLPTSTVASQLTGAALHLGYYSGDTGSRVIAVRHATSWTYCGTNYNNDCNQATTPVVTPLQSLSTGLIVYDVMSLVTPNWTVGAAPVGFALSSAENPGSHSYKQLNTALYLTYNRLPIPQQANMSPASPYTFHSSSYGVKLLDQSAHRS